MILEQAVPLDAQMLTHERRTNLCDQLLKGVLLGAPPVKLGDAGTVETARMARPMGVLMQICGPIVGHSVELARLRQLDEVLRRAVECTSAAMLHGCPVSCDKCRRLLVSDGRVYDFDRHRLQRANGLLVVEHIAGAPTAPRLVLRLDRGVSVAALLGEANRRATSGALEAREEDGGPLLVLLDEVPRLLPLTRASPPGVTVGLSGEHQPEAVEVAPVSLASGGVAREVAGAVPRHRPLARLCTLVQGCDYGLCHSFLRFLHLLVCAHVDPPIWLELRSFIAI